MANPPDLRPSFIVALCISAPGEGLWQGRNGNVPRPPHQYASCIYDRMARSYAVPASTRWINLALFTNVSNAAQLRSEATSGKLEAVLLDPTLVSAHSGI